SSTTHRSRSPPATKPDRQTSSAATPADAAPPANLQQSCQASPPRTPPHSNPPHAQPPSAALASPPDSSSSAPQTPPHPPAAAPSADRSRPCSPPPPANPSGHARSPP